jgi:hypothetical protein
LDSSVLQYSLSLLNLAVKERDVPGLLHGGMVNERVYELIGKPGRGLHAAINARIIHICKGERLWHD